MGVDAAGGGGGTFLVVTMHRILTQVGRWRLIDAVWLYYRGRLDGSVPEGGAGFAWPTGSFDWNEVKNFWEKYLGDLVAGAGTMTHDGTGAFERVTVELPTALFGARLADLQAEVADGAGDGSGSAVPSITPETAVEIAWFRAIFGTRRAADGDTRDALASQARALSLVGDTPLVWVPGARQRLTNNFLMSTLVDVEDGRAPEDKASLVVDANGTAVTVPYMSREGQSAVNAYLIRTEGDDDLDKGGASYAVAIEYDAGVVAGPVVRAFSRSLLQDLCGGVSGGSS